MRQTRYQNHTLQGTLAGLLLLPLFLQAQQNSGPAPATSRPPQGAVQSSQAPAARPAEPPAASGRRRDPFRTLIEKKQEETSTTPVRLPPGKRGLVIGQLQLQGIAQAVDGSWIAVVDNKTRRAYFLREGDQLYNGVVQTITKDQVVFLENPPGSPSGQNAPREVVMRLSAPE